MIKQLLWQQRSYRIFLLKINCWSNYIKWSIIQRHFKYDFVLATIISALLLSVLILFTESIFPNHPLFNSKWIHLGYINAAENPFQYNEAPFCWRILLSFLVFISPFNISISFFAITISSIWIASIFIYAILRKLSFDKEYSILGMVLFLSLVSAVRFNIMQFWYPDALLYLWITSAVYFIYTKNKLAFAVVLVLGTMTKETALLILPLYYMINNSDHSIWKFNTRLFTETLLLSIPALLTFILLRVFIPTSGEYNYLLIFKYTTMYRLETLVGLKSTLAYDIIENQPQLLTACVNLYRISLGAFGGLIILPLLSIRENHKYLREYVIFIILAYSQLLFAYDNERLLAIAFFPLILLTINTLRSLQVRYFIDRNIIRIFILLFFTVQLFFNFDIYQINYYSVFAQTIITIVLFLYLYFKTDKRSAGKIDT